jgi:hypothetical protein
MQGTWPTDRRRRCPEGRYVGGRSCSCDRPKAVPAIVAERRHPQGSTTCRSLLPPAWRPAGSSATRPSRDRGHAWDLAARSSEALPRGMGCGWPVLFMRPANGCAGDCRGTSTSPGIDDLPGSSSAGLAAGGVECNSTIPGPGVCRGPGRPIVGGVAPRDGMWVAGLVHATGQRLRRRSSRNVGIPRDRRLAGVFFRRPGGRRCRVQLDYPGMGCLADFGAGWVGTHERCRCYARHVRAGLAHPGERPI